MQDAAKVLLMLLALLVSRQRDLCAGRSASPALEAVREPREFYFHWRDGQLRCELPRTALPMLYAGVLVVEDGRFVAPVASLQPHVRISGAADRVLATLSGDFVDLVNVRDPDEVCVIYSPLQVLFGARCGFFLPGKESWHAYLSRALPGGGPAFEQAGAAMRMSYSDADLGYRLQVDARGFRLECSASGWLRETLDGFCAQSPLPAGVTVRPAQGSGVCIEGAA